MKATIATNTDKYEQLHEHKLNEQTQQAISNHPSEAPDSLRTF